MRPALLENAVAPPDVLGMTVAALGVSTTARPSRPHVLLFFDFVDQRNHYVLFSTGNTLFCLSKALIRKNKTLNLEGTWDVSFDKTRQNGNDLYGD